MKFTVVDKFLVYPGHRDTLKKQLNSLGLPYELTDEGASVELFTLYDMLIVAETVGSVVMVAYEPRTIHVNVDITL